MNYTPEDLLKYLYTAPKLREDALHALSHNDIDFSFIPVPPECLFLNRGGVFLKTQCEDGSVKSQNFEPDAERFKAKLRGFRKENTRIFIIHYKDETNLEFMTKKNKEETMDEAAENFLLLRFFELTGIDNIAKLQSFTKRCD